MVDQVANFIKVTVSTTYDASATSIELSSGEGAELPDPSGDNYNLSWWDSTNYPDPSDDPNVEVIRVTAKSTDTLTVTRNQEASGASTKDTSGATYKMILSATSKTITDLQADTTAVGAGLTIHMSDTSTHGVAEVANVATVSAEIDSDITTHAGLGDAHHTESHTVASHSDTTATGAELETLTDGSDSDLLHAHVINDAKITNATHTGDVTGSGALTIADDIVTYAKIQNVSADERILGNVTAIGSPVAELTKAQVLTMLNVADGANVTGSNAPQVHAVSHTDGTDDIQDATNAVKGLATATQITKLEGIETSADVTDAVNIASTINGVDSKTPPVDADDIPITDSESGNVLKRITWSTVKAVLKTYFDTLYNLYSHPNHTGEVTSTGDGATVITSDAVTYDKMQDTSDTDKLLGRSTAGAGTIEEIACTAAGRAILDDVDASAQRTTLGVDIAGTDNSTDVTLNASATTGGMSIATQEISHRAATNAQTGYMTATLVTNIETNNAKVTNATHTGDVTGDGALTIAAGAVDVAMLANGTDGELITWDAAGAPDTVAVGTATHVLTSNGVGTAPTFQAAVGGSQTVNIYLPAESAYLPITNPAQLVEELGATVYAGFSYLAFDDTTSEHAIWRISMPDYDGGNIVVTAYSKIATTPSGAVTLQYNILTIGLATSEAFDAAETVDTTVNISHSLNTTELSTDVMIASATIDPANVSSDDLMVIELSRDVASDNLSGDGELVGIMLEYTRS